MESKGFVSKSKNVNRIVRQRHEAALALLLYVIAVAWLLVSPPAFADESPQTIQTAQTVDPNKGPSEFNHHVAGWALIGVGVLALASLSSSRIKVHGYVWPALFILAGVYLAVWSDGEIWPRGNLSWSWLFQHDAEARQHKIYALLLIAIGIVEYLRVRDSLPRFWKMWAFPMIAVVGAGMLLIHDHSAGSGARTPEAQAYLVDPDLDVDGNPRGLSSSTTPGNNSVDHHQPANDVWKSAMDVSATNLGSMPMDHSQMVMDDSPETAVLAPHHHLMTASMVRVERQHQWFIIVGLAIGLFKFISDSEFFRSRLVSCLWPSCMMLLGMMLVFYRE